MTILSTIMRVESGGGHNILQGNIGDVNNARAAAGGGSYQLAQGYFQITGPTWADFGGNATGFSNPLAAPYSSQLQIAQNIPVSRWGGATQAALASAGYFPQRGETLGQMLTRYGEDPGATVAADGSTTGSGAGSTIAGGPNDTSSGVNAGSGSGTQVASNDPSSGLSNVPSDTTPTNIIGIDKPLTSAVGDWIKNIESSMGSAFSGAMTSALKSVGVDFGAMQNWFVRAGVILLGIVIIVAGLLGLFWEQGGKEIVQQYTPKFA
jgi:hypothetical protein